MLRRLIELPVVLEGLVLNRLILVRVIQSLRLLRPILLLLLLLSRILQLSGGKLLQWRRVLVLRCLLVLGRLLWRQLEVLLLLLLWWQGKLLLMVIILLSLLLPLGLEVLLVLLQQWARDGRCGHGLLLLHRVGLVRHLRLPVRRILPIASLLIGLVWRRHSAAFLFLLYNIRCHRRPISHARLPLKPH